MKKIKIRVDKEGDVHFEVEGVEGPSCEKLTEALARSAGEETEKRRQNGGATDRPPEGCRDDTEVEEPCKGGEGGKSRAPRELEDEREQEGDRGHQKESVEEPVGPGVEAEETVGEAEAEVVERAIESV